VIIIFKTIALFLYALTGSGFTVQRLMED